MLELLSESSFDANCGERDFLSTLGSLGGCLVSTTSKLFCFYSFSVDFEVIYLTKLLLPLWFEIYLFLDSGVERTGEMLLLLLDFSSRWLFDPIFIF